MQILGAGLTYLLKDDKAYLIGKLNHDSFKDVTADREERSFSFTIDTEEKFRNFDNASKLDEFSNFNLPMEFISDGFEKEYEAIDNWHDEDYDKNIPMKGRTIVQKVVYDRLFSPIGYIFFEFNIFQSKIVDENEILVTDSIHIKDYIQQGFKGKKVS